MKKDLINALIGVALCLVGVFLVNTGNTFLYYLGLILIIYGAFVAIVKFLKNLLLRSGQFKSIREFANNHNLIIPDFVNKVLEFRIKNNKEVTFEIPHFGTFHVLDYNNKKDENDFTNPNKMVDEVRYFVKQNFSPVFNFYKIIPVASNQSYTVLFVEEGKDDLILMDLDDSGLKPIVLAKKLNFYLDISKSTLENGVYHYNGLQRIEDLISKDKYFYDIPDGIFEGKDYLEILQKCFNLLEVKPEFSLLSVEELEDKYYISLEIENKESRMVFTKCSHYLDSENLVKALNDVLVLLDYQPSEKFYLLSYSICDFGIVLSDEKTRQKLDENGCLLFDSDNHRLSSDEIERVRNFFDLNAQIKDIEYSLGVLDSEVRRRSDLDAEIENIEFYLRVVRENNPIEKGLVYNFPYQTKCNLNDEDIAEIKKRFNVDFQKTETGYDVFFVG